MNIVLLGKTGAGKSASGNTILGGHKKTFEEDFSPSSVTKICRIEKTVVNEKTIHVIDTVGLPDTKKDFTDVQPEIEQIFACAKLGVDVFLLVIRLDVVFTEESRKVVKCIQENFGEKVSKHTIVLFTHADQLQEPIEDFLKKSSLLDSVVDQCSRRYHVFNNANGKQSQVTELLEKINKMREKNGNRKYTELDYKETQDAILKGKCVTGAAVGGGAGCTLGGAGCAVAAKAGAFAVTAGKAALIGASVGAVAGAALLGFGVYLLARKYVCKPETGENTNKKTN